MSTAISFVGVAVACRKWIWYAPRTPCRKAHRTEVLAWTAAEDRVLITKDRNTMVGFAYQRVVAGEPVPGLIATTNAQSIGSAINDISLIAAYMPEEEIRDQIVVFLPFRG